MKGSISPGPLVGRVVKSRSLRGVAITETSYAPDLVISRHSHRFHYFCAVLSGSFDDYAGSKHRFCRKSTVFFRPAEQVHEDRFPRSGARCLAVELKPELIERLGSSAPFLKEAGHFSGGAIFALSHRLHAELECWDEFSALAAEGLVLELISEVSRSTASGCVAGPRWLRKATELLAKDFAESIRKSIDRLQKELPADKFNYVVLLVSKNGHSLYREDLNDFLARWIVKDGKP